MALSSDYLKPQWQKKRLEILSRDNFTCVECGEKEHTLHVHHSHYTKGKKVWDYNNCTFITLCDDCHKKKHEDIKLIDPMKVLRLTELLQELHDRACDHIWARKDYEIYNELLIEYLASGEKGYIFHSLCEDEPETDNNINNFNIIESLLYNRIRPRNIKQYVDGCFMLKGTIIDPKEIGMELLGVSRDLNRSVFNG